MDAASQHTVVDEESSHSSITPDLEKQASAPSPPLPTTTPSAPTPERLLRVGLKKVTINGVLLLIVFWSMASWLFGSYYHHSSKVHQLHVLVVDFDGGAIGSAFLSAISQLNGQPSYPTFDIFPATTTSVDEINKRVFDGYAWGAIYVPANSSSNLEAALASEDVAASYRPERALVYTGLEARYYSIWSGDILASLKSVIKTTTDVFAEQVVISYLTNVHGEFGPNQAKVLAEPLGSTFLNQAPFPMGERAVMNTIGFILPVLLQFFFLNGLNMIFTMTGFYKRSTLIQHLRIRLPIILIWTIVTGISMASWQLTFKEDFHVDVRNVFALFAVGWAYSMIMFDLLDAVTTFVPHPYIPLFIIFFVISSVTSSSQPVDFLPSFYRVQFAVPSHPIWELMIMCYGHGATVGAKLHEALPIVLAWVVLAKVLAVLAMRHRVNARSL